VTAVGYKFSLILNRDITVEESAVLKKAGCSSAIFAADTLPTNAEVTVTKMEFDDTESPTLAEAIESALEAVKNVPNLSVPGLYVPAQPANPPAEDQKVVSATVESVTEEQTAEAEDKPVDKKQAKKSAKGTSTGKTGVKKKSVASTADSADAVKDGASGA
jgi:hypothetical protein